MKKHTQSVEDRASHETFAADLKRRGRRDVAPKPKRRSFKHARASALFAATALIAALVLVAAFINAPVVRVAKAASPASGTIAPTGPVPTFTGTWTGTATGTGSGGGE